MPALPASDSQECIRHSRETSDVTTPNETVPRPVERPEERTRLGCALESRPINSGSKQHDWQLPGGSLMPQQGSRVSCVGLRHEPAFRFALRHLDC